MKKRILVLVMMAVMAFTMCACGESNPTSEPVEKVGSGKVAPDKSSQQVGEGVPMEATQEPEVELGDLQTQVPGHELTGTAQMEEEEMEQVASGEYILPGSDTRLISDSEVRDMSASELRLARNEIMARHGRRFKDSALQEHFDNCSWYVGSMSPEDFDARYESILSQTEKDNVKLIQYYEGLK